MVMVIFGISGTMPLVQSYRIDQSSLSCRSLRLLCSLCLSLEFPAALGGIPTGEPVVQYVLLLYSVQEFLVTGGIDGLIECDKPQS